MQNSIYNVKATIVYPSGAHGSFLKLVLNHMAGVKYNIPNQTIFDKVEFPEGCIFDSNHFPKTNTPCINITSKYEDRLLYSALLLSRTSGYNVDLYDDEDVIKKLKSHIVLSFICDSFNNDIVTRKDLREIFRLTIFQDKNTLDLIKKPNRSDNPLMEINLPIFYSMPELLQACIRILNLTRVAIKRPDISSLHSLFLSRITCKNIGKDTKKIIDRILNFEKFNLGKLNFLQEAYIDDVLVKEFGVDPLCRDAYFTNSIEIFKTYNLKKK